jgi:CBS domain-containing protein
MSKSATALYNILKNHDFRARDVPCEKTDGIVEISHETHPVEGAKVLLEHGILGAVVWDESTHKYCGYFDMRDLLSSVTYATRKIQQQDIAGPYNAVMSESLGATLYYLAKRNPLHPAEPDTLLDDICKYLSTPRGRRVVICEAKNNRCTNVITRRSLLKFLRKNVDLSDLEETLKDAGLQYHKDVITVTDQTSAFDTFELMDSKGLYGIGIVDSDDGTLIGYTSASDVRLAAYDAGKSSMDLDIMSYLAIVRQLIKYDDAKTHYPVCHVYENATVAEVVNKLVKTGYHRIFVVNKEKKPVGVISLYDILKFVMNQSETNQIEMSC